MTPNQTPDITMYYTMNSETGKSSVHYSWPYAESDSTPRQRKKVEKVVKKYRKFMDAINEGRPTVIEGKLEITLTDTKREKEKPKYVFGIPPAGC
jgi:hypothetical protein